MKKTLIKSLALAFVGSLLMTGVASALSFSNTKDFGGTVLWKGQNFILVNDGNSSGYVGSYSHIVNFSPNAYSVDNATLTLSYAYANDYINPNVNNFNPAEIWLINEGNTTHTTPMGQLLGSTQAANLAGDWITQSFQFTDTLLAFVNSGNINPWTIAFKFNETSTGGDGFKLDKSILSGRYSPVPEPATMLLLGTGLIGLASARRRKAQK